MRSTIAPLFAALLLATGCGGTISESEVETSRAGKLTITEHSGEAFAGTFTDGVSAVTFRAVETTNDVFDIKYDFDGFVVTAKLDDNTGTVVVDGKSVAPSEQQQQLFKPFLAALKTSIPDSEEAGAPIEDRTMRIVNMLTEAEAGVAFPELKAVNTHGWEHIACERKNHWAWYGAGGYSVTREGGQTSTGGNGCWGRCGSGCDTSEGYKGGFTRDCLEHDHGLGPFGDTTDDYSWGGSNCRSRGSSTRFTGSHTGSCGSYDHFHDSNGAGIMGNGTCG